MPSLQELKDQIAELQQQAADLHAHESADAIATVKDLVSRYGLTAEQIGLSVATRPGRSSAKKPSAKSSRPGAGVAKFADPESGKTWTGFGKPPAWIAGAKDRNAFLISNVAAPRGKAPGKRAARKTKAPK